MRTCTYLSGISLVLLAGCTVVPPQAWTFDPTRPAAKAVLPTQDAVAFSDRLAQLQLERNEVRSRVAAERDAAARMALYERLHAVGVELSALDRRLSAYASAR